MQFFLLRNLEKHKYLLHLFRGFDQNGRLNIHVIHVSLNTLKQSSCRSESRYFQK